MKILLVCVHFPSPPRSGVNMRVLQLLRQLARRHDVHLLSYASPADRDGVAALSRELPVTVVERERPARLAKRAGQLLSVASSRPFASREVYSGEMQQAIDELCARGRFDAVQLEGSLLCEFHFPAGVKVILDEHNIEYEVFQRMCEGERSAVRRAFHRLEHRRFRRFEQRAWQAVDGCVVTSEREAPVVRSISPATPTVVVPNGVDVDEFTPSRIACEPNTMVFNGTLEYRPNVDAAQYLVDEIWPLVRERCPNAGLTIVGRAPSAVARRLRRPGVQVTGEVPDVRSYLHRAAVVAVPIRMGGGTRLKVVEGLAMGKAMVSTTLGCEGIAVRDGEHLLIADEPHAFAGRVLDLFESPARRRGLGAAGRRLAEAEYTWALAGERLEELYRQVAPARCAAVAA